METKIVSSKWKNLDQIHLEGRNRILNCQAVAVLVGLIRTMNKRKKMDTLFCLFGLTSWRKIRGCIGICPIYLYGMEWVPMDLFGHNAKKYGFYSNLWITCIWLAGNHVVELDFISASFFIASASFDVRSNVLVVPLFFPPCQWWTI